jgi:hypothetical protein
MSKSPARHSARVIPKDRRHRIVIAAFAIAVLLYGIILLASHATAVSAAAYPKLQQQSIAAPAQANTTKTFSHPTVIGRPGQ